MTSKGVSDVLEGEEGLIYCPCLKRKTDSGMCTEPLNALYARGMITKDETGCKYWDWVKMECVFGVQPRPKCLKT